MNSTDIALALAPIALAAIGGIMASFGARSLAWVVLTAYIASLFYAEGPFTTVLEEINLTMGQPLLFLIVISAMAAFVSWMFGEWLGKRASTLFWFIVVAAVVMGLVFWFVTSQSSTA